MTLTAFCALKESVHLSANPIVQRVQSAPVFKYELFQARTEHRDLLSCCTYVFQKFTRQLLDFVLAKIPRLWKTYINFDGFIHQTIPNFIKKVDLLVPPHANTKNGVIQLFRYYRRCCGVTHCVNSNVSAERIDKQYNIRRVARRCIHFFGNKSHKTVDSENVFSQLLKLCVPSAQMVDRESKDLAPCRHQLPYQDEDGQESAERAGRNEPLSTTNPARLVIGACGCGELDNANHSGQEKAAQEGRHQHSGLRPLRHRPSSFPPVPLGTVA